MTCTKQQEADRTENDVKVFLRYVDEIFRTVEGDPGVVLEPANKFHPNLQFTIKELDSKDILLTWIQEKSSHKVGTKNSVIPAPF